MIQLVIIININQKGTFMISRKIVFSSSIFLLATMWLVPMGEQVQPDTQKEPAFTPLEEGEDFFNGRIMDDQTITEVTQLSLYGYTKVGGIRRDDDDSVTTLNLANTKAIKIQQQVYTSKKYPEKDFALIQKTALDGTVTDGLLLPRHVIICGIEKKTGDEKAWYLSKIDELIVQPAASAEPEAPAQNTPAPTPAAPVATIPDSAQDAPHVPATTPTTTPLSANTPIATEKKEYKNMFIKVVEKEPEQEIVNQKKTVIQAITDLLAAVIGVIKAVYEFIKGLFWS